MLVKPLGQVRSRSSATNETRTFSAKDHTVDTAITQEEIATFATNWYKKLDNHAPMVDCLSMLADKDPKMVFPETTVTGRDGFERWYQTALRTFFDEAHIVKSTKARIKGDSATVKVVVHWEASIWKAPSAKSCRIVADAYQT